MKRNLLFSPVIGLSVSFMSASTENKVVRVVEFDLISLLSQFLLATYESLRYLILLCDFLCVFLYYYFIVFFVVVKDTDQ